MSDREQGYRHPLRLLRKGACDSVISGYHIKFSTEADFLRRLNAGEDFEAWCVRYGVQLLDRGAWERIKSSSANVWPRWDIKVVHGIRRLFLASELSKMGDREAAREELIFGPRSYRAGIVAQEWKVSVVTPRTGGAGK